MQRRKRGVSQDELMYKANVEPWVFGVQSVTDGPTERKLLLYYLCEGLAMRIEYLSSCCAILASKSDTFIFRWRVGSLERPITYRVTSSMVSCACLYDSSEILCQYWIPPHNFPQHPILPLIFSSGWVSNIRCFRNERRFTP